MVKCQLVSSSSTSVFWGIILCSGRYRISGRVNTAVFGWEKPAMFGDFVHIYTIRFGLRRIEEAVAILD